VVVPVEVAPVRAAVAPAPAEVVIPARHCGSSGPGAVSWFRNAVGQGRPVQQETGGAAAGGGVSATASACGPMAVRAERAAPWAAEGKAGETGRRRRRTRPLGCSCATAGSYEPREHLAG